MNSAENRHTEMITCWCQETRMNRKGTKDRHKAPPCRVVRPLSLQNMGPVLIVATSHKEGDRRGPHPATSSTSASTMTTKGVLGVVHTSIPSGVVWLRGLRWWSIAATLSS